MIRNGLIGYTGTVGSHLVEQYTFDKLYNSKNIQDIDGESFDILYVSAISAAKYIANKEPEEDKQKIDALFEHLKTVSANTVIFISTIDVHNDDAYGRNRLYAEQRISSLFKNVRIIRLPGLVGKHIKKNFIYDICHNKDLAYTSINSVFEFMNLEDLKHACLLSYEFNRLFGVNILEIRSEPVSAVDICNYLGIDKHKLNSNPGAVYGHVGTNFYTKEQELEFIRKYVEEVSVSN